MNVLLCLRHSIEEYDQVRLFDSLGYGVFSIGGYIDPSQPHDRKRPALPDVPFHPELKKAVDDMGGNAAAQSAIPPAILEWLGDDGVTFDVISKEMGVSKQRIQQLETAAFKKLGVDAQALRRAGAGETRYGYRETWPQVTL